MTGCDILMFPSNREFYLSLRSDYETVKCFEQTDFYFKYRVKIKSRVCVRIQGVDVLAFSSLIQSREL